MSAYERETSIVLNDEEPVAHVYTAQASMMRRLVRHPGAVLMVRHEDEKGRTTGEEWDVPKQSILIRFNRRKGHPMTEGQRRALAKARAVRFPDKLQGISPKQGLLGSP